jgi:hypothetical protein
MAVTTSPLQDSLSISRTASRLDARPILCRSRENAWERAEQLRQDLYVMLERICAERGLEALVLQSYPYMQPAWVKFESWIPAEPAMSARAAMTITILTRPYHRFEAVYKVEWEKHGKKGSVDDLYRCGEAQVTSLLTLLVAPPAPSLTQRRIRRLLSPVQLRQQAHQLWKPRNKVSMIRSDWIHKGSFLSVLAGAALLFASLQVPSLAPDAFVSAFDPSIPVSNDVPSRSMGVELTSSSPEVHRDAGQTSSLDGTDSRLNDGRLYEMRRIQARAGEPVAVRMRSSDFDTFLVLGEIKDGTFQTLQINDDGGDDGSNSRLEFVPATTGEYLVLFSSFEQGQTGTYTFEVQ